jgi:hypothetical protein
VGKQVARKAYLGGKTKTGAGKSGGAETKPRIGKENKLTRNESQSATRKK